jgi:hypothetical protein
LHKKTIWGIRSDLRDPKKGQALDTVYVIIGLSADQLTLDKL